MIVESGGKSNKGLCSFVGLSTKLLCCKDNLSRPFSPANESQKSCLHRNHYAVPIIFISEGGDLPVFLNNNILKVPTGDMCALKLWGGGVKDAIL